MSAQEAAARIGHLQLVWSTRNVVYVNTRPENMRYKVLKPKSERDQLQANSSDIFVPNIIDYYKDRPTSLAKFSLFKFASWYKVSPLQTTNVSSKCQPRIRLKTIDKVLQKKCSANVIRTPKFAPQSEEYLYSLLMLHLPFTNEDEIFYPYATAKDAFIHKYLLFNTTDLQYESFIHDIERVVHNIKRSQNEIAVMVAPNTHEITDQSETIAPEYNAFCTENLPPDISDTEMIQDTSTENFMSLQLGTISEAELNTRKSHFSEDQHTVFSIVVDHFEKAQSVPLRTFITGGAGTGKSYLTTSIVEWIRLFACTHPGLDPVLVCGPTGMSARNIQGRTLHSAFK